MDVSEAKRLRVGTRVKFEPSAASAVLYSRAPASGSVGTVTAVSFGASKRKSYLPGPGGGLLYVDWEDVGVCGVGAGDVERV